MDRATAHLSKWPGLVSVVLSFFFSLLFQFSAAQEKAQEKNLPATLVTVNIRDKPFGEALSIIEYKIPYKFAYGADVALGQKNISLSVSGMPLTDFLALLFQGTSLTYQVIGDQIVLGKIVVSSKITLSGFVKDVRTGESLIGATIYIPSAGRGVVSSNYGFYSISVASADTMDLEISYVGYKSLFSRVSARNDLTLSFGLELNTSQVEIHPLTIANDRREDNVKKNQLGLIEMSTDMITTAPSAAGSGDIISSVEMLPGVQAGIDGTPGFFVRGGNAGQNLILLDGATLYNPSHIFGLVGVFNPPAIKYANLMKGGFPAAYGDHVSSVLDVVMKDGSNQQFGGVGQMGSVSSGVTLYGPLQPGRSSFLVSGRRSTTDVLLHPFFHKNYFSNYYFYDVNAKLNFQVSPMDRLFVSFYSGRDNNNYSSDSADVSGIDYSMHFGNTAFSVRWNHQYSGKLFSNTSVDYNHYHQWLSATEQGYFAQLYSGIRDIHAKYDLAWYLSPEHKINAGADFLYQQLYPATLSGKASVDTPGKIVPDGIPPKTASRAAVYASDDIKIGGRWQINAGVRVPVYYKQDVHYLSVEPRLSLLYLLDPATSIKMSYANMHQYIHLVQSYNSAFPAEVWIGSSSLVRPQVSQEVTVGLFKNFSENIFQTSLEFYYRRMKNQLLFGGGGDSASIDNTIENQLIFGRAWSYGTELFIRKNRGKWTGWLAYSFAYTYQQFDSLNEGKRFPFAYDRRHMLNISTAYAIHSHWKIAANFLIASGRAFSLSPDSTFNANGGNPLYAGNRGRGQGRGRPLGTSGSWDVIVNNYRLSPYNRLDFSVHYLKSRIIGRRTLETEWIFSVYNVYARRNNSFVYRTIDPSTRKIIAKELSFIPVIPSITYSLKF